MATMCVYAVLDKAVDAYSIPLFPVGCVCDAGDD